jgi:hypothetical protein
MDEPRSRYGKASGAAFTLSLVIAAGLGSILGALYGSGCFWTGPLEHHFQTVYGLQCAINFLLFVATFLALCRITRAAARWARFRSLTVARAVGFVGGLACLTSAWAAHASWSSAKLTLLPGTILSHASHHLQRPGATFFTILAATEAGMLLFLTSGAARRYMMETPLCDVCRTWLQVDRGVYRFNAANLHKLLPSLVRGDLAILREALPASPHDHVRMDLAACGQCESDVFISVLRHKEQIAPDGNPSVWQEIYIRNARIPRSELKHLA